MYLEDRTVRLQLWDTAGQVINGIFDVLLLKNAEFFFFFNRNDSEV